MTLTTLGFVVGIAGSLLAAFFAFINRFGMNQPRYMIPMQGQYQTTYQYEAPAWGVPAYNQPMYNQPVYNQPMPQQMPVQAPVANPVMQNTISPWARMAYVTALANAPIVNNQTYSNAPVYSTDNLGCSMGGPKWDPPMINYFGVGNDIRPSPTGSPPGWKPPQFVPPSAYW